jgi:hypothetical protein
VMAGQATALGAADPAGPARQLTVLYDGALAQSRPGRGPAAATAARAAARVLTDAAAPARRKPRARPARAPPGTRHQPGRNLTVPAARPGPRRLTPGPGTQPATPDKQSGHPVMAAQA